MNPVVRFAPSPTGRLHLGNLRTALINWLYARRHGGTMLLRIDDTDTERSTAANARAIEADLAWLGLNWDRFARQSDRLARYEAAAAYLKSIGRLYPAFESSEELELKRKLALGRGKPPLYDRAALRLSQEEKDARIAAGAPTVWRFKLDSGTTAWTDLLRGPVSFEGDNLSDPILIRADGAAVYTLASVVDDLDLGVTHVLRGEDHVANTAVQIQIFAALADFCGRSKAIDELSFGHFALIGDASGEKLSKRTGSTSLEMLRDEGVEPMALLSLLAKLGTSDAIELRPDLATLIAEFNLDHFGRSRPKLDLAELWHLNEKEMHLLPYEAVKDRLPPGADEAFWLMARANITRVGEAGLWWQVVKGPITPVNEDPAFLIEAATLLPTGAFDETSWATWTNAIKQATGRKGKSLFHPLRLALTGLDHGPELAKLLPLIGRTQVLERLKGHGFTLNREK